MIRLEKIHAKNVWDIVDLKVAEAQTEFVATNSDSIILLALLKTVRWTAMKL